MACALHLAEKFRVTLYERSDRLGKKLSATGNGQGNVTNLNMGAEYYFSDGAEQVKAVLARFNAEDCVRFLEGMGGIFLPDSRGRVYPAGRQASAVTDLFRAELARRGVELKLNRKITQIKRGNGFSLTGEGFEERADAVVLCAGGMAAPNFGTDGNGYALAKGLGHTVTDCTPSLVQLRCDPSAVRGLKGIRSDARLRVLRKGKEVYAVRGDVLFTESGISGDATFRASAYAKAGDLVEIDFLPDVPFERLRERLARQDDLLCIVNNGLGRVLTKLANGNRERTVALIKGFPLEITGTLGFAYAQVTKGGIPLAEVDGDLMSKKCRGLYFAGEILNVDGACGGYNLQWAFASAYTVSEGVKNAFEVE